MENKTLLILAAGIGSRFGGLKQIEPIDQNGNFIIDYSVFDAIKAGFNKVVFVIKKENYEIFRTTIGKRIERFVNVEYAFQDINSFVPKSLDTSFRTKPWGTAHAVLCAKDKIKGNFAIINADDFYSFESYKTAINFMETTDNKTYGIIVYKIGNTLTENGSVKRGICEEKFGYLTKMTECIVEKVANKIMALPISGGNTFELKPQNPASMNFMCLNSNFFSYLENSFNKFLSNSQNLAKDEFLIQDAMFNQSQEENIKIKLIQTSANWYGITYKEDKANLTKQINKLINANLYPHSLWNK